MSTENKLYALNLAEDGRVLSVTFDKYAPAEYPRVESLPEGDVSEYLFVDGEFVHDPLPEPEAPEVEPTTEDILNVLLGVEV